MKKLTYFTTVLLFCIHALIAFAHANKIDPDNIFPNVKFETSMGDIIVELDRLKAPETVDNFLLYVVTKEYDNTVFHRVIEDFIVQGGGLTPDYQPKEIHHKIHNESGNGLKNIKGTIAMARENRPHTATRQFFFNVGNNKSLNPGRNWGYTVFGEVIEGMDVVEKMAEVETEFNTDLAWQDVPVKKIILKKATLLPAE